MRGMGTPHEEVGVLGVDDQPFFLDVVARGRVADARLPLARRRVSGEAAVGGRGLVPALVLLDVHMPDMDGLATTSGASPIGARTSWSCSSRWSDPRAGPRGETSGAAVLIRKQEFWPPTSGGCGVRTPARRQPRHRVPRRGSATRARGRPPSAATRWRMSPSSSPRRRCVRSRRRSRARRRGPRSAGRCRARAATQIRVEPGACFGDVLHAPPGSRSTPPPRPRRVALGPAHRRVRAAPTRASGAERRRAGPWAASAAGYTPAASERSSSSTPSTSLRAAGASRGARRALDPSSPRRAGAGCAARRAAAAPSWRSRSIRRRSLSAAGGCAPGTAAARRWRCPRARRGAGSRPDEREAADRLEERPLLAEPGVVDERGDRARRRSRSR